MPQTAFQTQYRQEFIAGFEQHQSLLRDTTTTEAVIKGNQATFLIADSGNATAVTRGVNGLIPSRPDNLNQNTAVLLEWHDKPIATGFNIFASQGNRRSIMQMTTMGVINRRIDQDILTELSTATVTVGAATTATQALVVKAKAVLQLASVPWDNQIYGLISPAFEAYLSLIPAYTSSDYVDGRPLVDGGGWNDKPQMRRWMGVNWIVHPKLPGVGTGSESCFLYHKSAIGHAANVGEIMSNVGYDEEDDYSYARTSMYMGAKILQNSGVVKMLHDGSAYVGT